jgi:hypothetical protein
MGSFGNKTSQVNAATEPYAFQSPIANLSYKGHHARYNPYFTDDQKSTQSLTDSKLLGTLQSLPTSFNVNDAYNNPFYGDTKKLYQAPIMEQYGADAKELNNRLTAQNQLGSSYDAYSRNLLDQRRDSQLGQADARARLASFDAYQQQFGNLLATLQGLRTDRNSALNAALAPIQAANGVQTSLSPLQGAQANYLANRKSPLESWLNYGAQAAGAIAPFI